MTIYSTFVYQWTNLTTNRKYIGYHKGSEDDGYVSSSKYFNEDYNTNPSNFKREILAWGSTQDMIALETKLLKEVDAARNPDYYNRFNGDGRFYITEHSEETRQKQSAAAKKRDATPYKGRMSVRDKITGKIGKIDCSEYDKNVHDLAFCQTDKKVTVVDENGNSFAVSKEEYQKNKDKWKTHSSIWGKNKVGVRDKNGNLIRVDKNDPRIGIDYEIDRSVGERCKNTVPVYDASRKCFRVDRNDERIKTGELVLQCGRALTGRICINNGKINKKIYPQDIVNYPGWTKGMKPRI